MHIFYAAIFSFIFGLSYGDYILFTIISFFAGIGLSTELIFLSILLAKWIVSYPERKEFGNGYYACISIYSQV